MFRGSIVNFFSQWPVPVFLGERLVIFFKHNCVSLIFLILYQSNWVGHFCWNFFIFIFCIFIEIMYRLFFFVFVSTFIFFSFVYNNVWVDFCCLFQSIKRIAWHQTVTRIAASIPINLWLWRVGVDTLLLRWNLSFSNVSFPHCTFSQFHNNYYFSINFVVIKKFII